MTKRTLHPLSSILYPLASVALLAGCDTRKMDMYYQPHHEPYESSDFYPDGQSARPLVPGTVARQEVRPYKQSTGGFAERPADDMGGGFPADFPAGGPDLQARVARGQDRFNIYCSPCHGLNGLGDGMIVQRGFTKPPSFVLIDADKTENPYRYEREVYLQNAEPGYYYHVVTHGMGAMYGYAERVSPEDRWNIIAYVKALQATKPALTTQGPAATLGPDRTRQGNE